ncbi:hypothetical protein [Jiangella endophytica]|uniref:hypothetical protein n=1 Tax=Jiangella endophytica TaxID=1623398 RepID=UPI000E349A95|nr:hypothetical protein [Jiangella endophytica]
MSAGLDDLELRPSSRRRRSALVLGVVVTGLITVFLAIPGGIVGLLGGLVLAAVVLAILHGHLRRARVVLTRSEIAVRGLVVHRRRDRARAASVVRAVVIPVRGSMADTVFVRDRDDHVLLRIHGSNYETADLDQLVARLGLPTGGPGAPVTAAQLARRYPGIVPFAERRPIAFSLLVAFGSMALLIIVLAVVSSTR